MNPHQRVFFEYELFSPFPLMLYIFRHIEVYYTDEFGAFQTHTPLHMDLSTLLKSVIAAAHVTPSFRYYVLH